MTVNLNTCVPEQQCITGDGRFLTYVKKINNALHYPHLLLDQDSGEKTFTNDGRYDIRNLNGKYNIVHIIPMESATSDKHPSVAWWESCPWITDRKPTEADGNAMGWVMTKPTNSLDAATVSWSGVETSQPWIHRLNWQPPVLSNKEQALELLNKHEGGWCPTPKEWTIIRKGLEE
jgi:hypothetical protein